MKNFLLITFILFFSSNSYSENAYVMDNNSPGVKQCYEVISDFSIQVKGKEMFGMFDDPERLRKITNQEGYWAYYYGFELALAMAFDESITKTFSRSELSELFVKHCLDRKSSDKFFQILTDIHRSKF